MVINLIEYLPGFTLAFLTGILSKLTDLNQGKKKLSKIALVTGFGYGLAYALLLSFGIEFATLFLGIAIAVLLSGKIDSLAHQFAVAAFLLMLVFTGFPSPQGFNVPILLGIVLIVVFDEKLNDFVMSKRKQEVNSAIKFIGAHRLSLEIFTFIIALTIQNWLYFLALIAFDVGYSIIALVIKGGKNG